MPQLLSNVAPNAQYSIGNACDRVLSKRPELAVLAMEAIASWSNVESHLLATFVELMGGKASKAASVYLALSTQNAKSAAIQAAALASLSAKRKAIFDAILAIAKTNQKKRDALAHGVWGISQTLNDVLLLANSKAMHSTYPKPNEIYVYNANDFREIISANDRLCGYAGTFWHVIKGNRSPLYPSLSARDILKMLSLSPEIQEKLSRRVKPTQSPSAEYPLPPRPSRA